MIATSLSLDEAALLDLAERIGFGDIYDVTLDRSLTANRQVSPAQARFLGILARDGVCHLARVTIHEGVPVQIEVEGERDGIRYTQKIRV